MYECFDTLIFKCWPFCKNLIKASISGSKQVCYTRFAMQKKIWKKMCGFFLGWPLYPDWHPILTRLCITEMHDRKGCDADWKLTEKEGWSLLDRAWNWLWSLRDEEEIFEEQYDIYGDVLWQNTLMTNILMRPLSRYSLPWTIIKCLIWFPPCQPMMSVWLIRLCVCHHIPAMAALCQPLLPQSPNTLSTFLI